MKATVSLALSCAALALSLEANAIEPHSYTYIEGGYWQSTGDVDQDLTNDSTIEADGYSIAASYRSDNGLLLQGFYSEGEVDSFLGFSPSDLGLDLDSQYIGALIGAAQQINERASFYTGIEYGVTTLDFDINSGGGSFSDDTKVRELSLIIGGRYTLVRMLELEASVRAIHYNSPEKELDFSDNDGIVTVGLRFQPIDALSFGIYYAAAVDSDIDEARANIRWQF